MVKRTSQQERIEPAFGSALDEKGSAFRLTEEDRPVPSNQSRAPVSPARSRTKKTGKQTSRASKRHARGGFFGFLRRSFYWGIVLSLWGSIAVVGVLAYIFATLPPTDGWVIPERPPNIEIVDATGTLIANRGDTGGAAIRLKDMPPYLPEAVIAIEDRRFYHHFGIDPIGLGRAIFTNVTSGNLVQGGSTVTQQLAKNLFLTPDRTLDRKLQEVVLSLWLEWKFSKDEILEMYLNRVYLGNGAYGVDGAARRYYGKSARNVTLMEAATLAGLLKAPSRYAPSRDPELAASRAQTVLATMVESGFITEAEAQAAVAEGAPVVTEHNSSASNYVADWVMDLLPGYIGSVTSDLVVSTTIDADMEQAAENALRDTLIKEGADHRVGQGALVAIANDGAVKALVGGRDYAASQFDRALAARRQPGSAFKPFVYLAAIERGYTPDHIMIDEPISIKGWQPKNYDEKYLGPVTLQTALAKSLNTVAARLAAEIGPGNVAQTARRVGITSLLNENPSIGLGTSEVTPFEITAAYVPFANGGNGVMPYVIDRITTKTGKVLFERQLSLGTGKVIDPRSLGLMNRMMQNVLENGTGQKAILPGRPAGGKTGTSQDFRDAWFIGYVDGLTAGVWLGNDDNSSTKKATGGSLTAIVWNRFMTEAVKGLPVRPLPGTEMSIPKIPSSTTVADTDALPSLGPNGPVMSKPATEIPVNSATDDEKSLLDRLFGQ